MKTTRIAAALGVAVVLFVVLSAPPLIAAHAQCGLPGTPDCQPGGNDKEKNKRPTPTPAPRFILVPLEKSNNGLPTIAALATPTLDPALYATARACWDGIYRLTPNPALPTASWGDILVDSPQCIPGPPPTAVPLISLTKVAGPLFVPPGVKNVIIAVLLLGGVLIGLILIARRLRSPSPIKPPNQNKPPGPSI